MHVRALLETMREEAMPVTFSFGVASFAAPPESADDALKQADQPMYQSKKNGKNQIEYATVGAQQGITVSDIRKYLIERAKRES